MKTAVVFVLLLNLLAPFTPAFAACDLCVCGPGGDYRGDVDEWFRNNCPGRGGARPQPPAGCDNKCPEGYRCREGVNEYGPVYQCYIPGVPPGNGNGRPIGDQ